MRDTMGASPKPVNGLAFAAPLDWLLPPRRPHPVRRMFLEECLAGGLSQQDFLWAFHLPDSDYLPVAACIVKALSELSNANPTLHLQTALL